MSSWRSFYFAAISLAVTWSSGFLSMNAAASNFAHSSDLTNAIAQNHSPGYGYDQNPGSQDLLPPSLGGGAKIQPTVTPPSASIDSGQGYGSSNGGSGGYGGSGGHGGNGGYGGHGSGGNYMRPDHGHHHHHHGHNGGPGYSSSMRGGGAQASSYGRWNNSSSSNSSQANGGPVITIWNAPKNGSSPSHSEPGSPGHSLSTSSTGSSHSSARSAATSSTPRELQAAANQTHEMSQKFAQEAADQIQQIHARAAARRRELSAQISANNQNNSMNYRRHRSGNRGGGHHHNSNSNGANGYLQKELSHESTFEQKQVESIQKQYEAKERAIHDAADNLAAHYDASGNGSVPRLGATRNDLHVQNYEINDTASGAEVPLVATPKSLH